MIFRIIREYWPAGTNGTLQIEDFRICKTIEQPWRRNDRDSSCIPEGTYRLEKAYSETAGWHLSVKGVPGRKDTMICPYTGAGKDLKDCIVPVTATTGEGKGVYSCRAFEKFKEMVYQAMAGDEEVLLEIRSYPDSALNLARYGIQWMD